MSCLKKKLLKLKSTSTTTWVVENSKLNTQKLLVRLNLNVTMRQAPALIKKGIIKIGTPSKNV